MNNENQNNQQEQISPLSGGEEGNSLLMSTEEPNEVSSELASLLLRRTSNHPPSDLVQKYISQLIYGCQNSTCNNPFCASNPNFKIASSQEIASYAASLAKIGTQHLCSSFKTLEKFENPSNLDLEVTEEKSFSVSDFKEIVQHCLSSQEWAKCLQVIYNYFSEVERLSQCFRSVDGDLEVKQLVEFYDILTRKCPNTVISCMMTAVACMLDRLKLSDKQVIKESLESLLMVIICPALLDSSFHSIVMVRLCDFISNNLDDDRKEKFGRMCLTYVIRVVSLHSKVQLSRKLDRLESQQWYSYTQRFIKENLKAVKVEFSKFVSVLQHFIAIRVDSLVAQLGPSFSPNSDEPICNATKTLAIFNSLNNKYHIVHFTEFYNYAINDHLEIKDDFPHWKARKGFSFCNYPFILNAAIKSDILKIESMIQMRHELQDSFFRALFIGVNSPYLVIEVRRDNIIRDALYQLDGKKPQDLKKQLKVQFIGEEAVDEGGVQKEFFQLAVREIFDEKYSMFRKTESKFYWFNNVLEYDKNLLEEIKLVGILLGLAIYNGVILDLHFPLVLYKKLLNVPVGIDDLLSLEPSLARGLQTLLIYDGNVESDFERNFQIDLDIFGTIKTFDLVENGSKIAVNNQNRSFFVEKYVKFLLDVHVEEGFSSFKEGFNLVCGDSAISLFKPEELELLICGGSDFDFEALKEVTTYDGGYSLSTPVIQHFWDIVLQFNELQKRRLLFFATGSDRVPIGGLAKLNFVIVKNGPDSSRLPTSHTCFNVLMLPEYSTEEKLKDKLLTAIQNSEGFGMI